MAQIYKLQSMGDTKQDISINISKQGMSTVVNVQPKDYQKMVLSIAQ